MRRGPLGSPRGRTLSSPLVKRPRSVGEPPHALRSVGGDEERRRALLQAAGRGQRKGSPERAADAHHIDGQRGVGSPESLERVLGLARGERRARRGE